MPNDMVPTLQINEHMLQNLLTCNIVSFRDLQYSIDLIVVGDKIERNIYEWLKYRDTARKHPEQANIAFETYIKTISKP